MYYIAFFLRFIFYFIYALFFFNLFFLYCLFSYEETGLEKFNNLQKFTQNQEAKPHVCSPSPMHVISTYGQVELMRNSDNRITIGNMKAMNQRWCHFGCASKTLGNPQSKRKVMGIPCILFQHLNYSGLLPMASDDHTQFLLLCFLCTQDGRHWNGL